MIVNLNICIIYDMVDSGQCFQVISSVKVDELSPENLFSVHPVMTETGLDASRQIGKMTGERKS